MLYVLTYLEERGIDLEQPEFNAESEAINSTYGLTTLITPARRLVDQLDPSAHREEELVAHFDEMGMAFERAAGRSGHAAAVARHHLRTPRRPGLADQHRLRPTGIMPSVEAADMDDDVLRLTARVAVQDLKPDPVPVRLRRGRRSSPARQVG